MLAVGALLCACACSPAALARSAGADWEINRQAHSPEDGVESGVRYADGDGTVPLISLGAMCEGGWRTKKLNPHGVKARFAVCLLTSPRAT